MKLINKTTGEAVSSDIIANHSVSIDEILDLLQWQIDSDGEVLTDDGRPVGVYYEELDIIY